jgi:hypothetical protein
VRTVPSREPLKCPLRLELDLKNEKGVEKYQAKIVRSVAKEFLEYVTSGRISEVYIKGWLDLVQGDFNRPLQHNTNPPS